jgi:hypothetical protein
MSVDAYRAVVDKRDQRFFTDRPLPDEALRRILQAAPTSVRRKRTPLTELVHWETW